MLLEEHRGYLGDRVRVDAFRRAIHATVRPGDVVLDLGCGTGVLGIMACEAGAARVYAVDQTGMIEVAREIAARNGLAGRISHIAGRSSHLTLPERADVLVFDQIGPLGFEAGLLELAADARLRLLKPGARIIPAAVTLQAALVSAPAMRARVDFWQTRPAGIDCSPAFATAVNSIHALPPEAATLVSPPADVMTFDTTGARSGNGSSTIDLHVTAGTDADGLAGWFRAELAPGVVMTNAPGAADRINRPPAFLPFERPLTVRRGERITATLRVLPADMIVTWDIARDDGAVLFSHSTWKGLLATHETLARTRPGARPRLNERGRARLAVLDLCSGGRTVREIESALSSLHPGLFAEPEAAAVFVAEVLSVCAEP